MATSKDSMASKKSVDADAIDLRKFVEETCRIAKAGKASYLEHCHCWSEEESQPYHVWDEEDLQRRLRFLRALQTNYKGGLRVQSFGANSVTFVYPTTVQKDTLQSTAAQKTTVKLQTSEANTAAATTTATAVAKK